MTTKQSPTESFLSFVLPKDTLKWFDITNTNSNEEALSVTLVEKNNPPKSKNKLIFKGYKTITATDFPIRDKRVNLTFKRRYWKSSNSKQLISNDIPLVFPGTKLQQEFADFLKDESTNKTHISFVYSDSLQSQS